MTSGALVLLALAIPFAAALLIPLAHRRPNLREAITLVAAGALFATVCLILGAVLAGERPAAGTLEVVPNLEIGFLVEPLGMIFACVASTLWILNSIYSIGYMRGNNEPRQTSFYVCFAVALAATMGIAFAANLFTLFLFYEILTLSTYPLVTHKGTEAAMRAGRIYLLLLIGTSMTLLLPAIIWTGALAGTLDFVPGGILAGKASPALTGVLLGLFAFGIGKAALMPIHYWLPAAMVAPTPVSALLHAVAVVKAGVFSVTKVVVYVFGIDFLAETGASQWLVFVASFTLVVASVVALSKDNLKARLAYSTVSQLSYVVLGAAMVAPASIVAAGMQIAMHAVGKITLFFCAGAIYTAAHKTEISDMAGIGRAMPVTMIAFLIGAVSIIGLPPLGGAWTKWYLSLGAVESGDLFVIGVLFVSSLLNIAYLLPIVARGFFMPPRGSEADGETRIKEAPLACLIPLCITAFLCIFLFFQAGPIQALLEEMIVDSQAALAGETDGGAAELQELQQ
ncbi:monovalent cation/H+ antiporter subunit D family protein [Microbaculum marinum]|uniref:Monovalent cation/H+ antiporter subunit D family protein n=1 Tax=Microbaculum marinum TaxID=1764581 RepID=A0AAW9RR07_9HYPH